MRKILSTLSISLMACIGSAAAHAGEIHLSSFSRGKTPDGAAAFCQAFAQACHRTQARATTPDDAAMLAAAQRINREVNRAITPGVIGSHPWRIVSEGPGDCTNYVATKKKKLVEAGVPASRLLAAVVVGDDNALHAVLVLRLATGDLILDNLDDAIRPWARTRYTFLKMQNPSEGAQWDVVLMGPRASRI